MNEQPNERQLVAEARELALQLAEGKLGKQHAQRAAYLLAQLAALAEGEPPIDWRTAGRVMLHTRRCEAYAETCGDGLVVKQGSIASGYAADSLAEGYARLRVALLQQGVLVPHARGLVFATDHKFTSPSAAACVLTGTQSSGNALWKAIP